MFLHYRDGCDHDHDPKSCEIVGFSYQRGEGVDKDILMARRYFQKGCDLRDEASCLQLKSFK